MLRLKKMTIKNFGPYYGESVLDFSPKDGVTVIWGYNGMGKTSLLNCFRFVMWGAIYNRAKESTDLYKYVNTQAVKEGEGMSVVLHMDYNGVDYTLTRKFQRSRGTGKSDDDYDMLTYLNRGSDTLSTQEMKRFLENAFPERTSRFYLFDGELLSEYEELLDENSLSNEKIKRSIEDILGLPILENGVTSIASIVTETHREYQKASQSEKATEKDGKALASARENLSNLEISAKDLEIKIDAYKAELEEIDKKRSDSVSLREKIQRIDVLTDEIKGLEGTIASMKSNLRVSVDKLWLFVLNQHHNSLIASSEIRRNELEDKRSMYTHSLAVKEYLLKAIENSSDSCPICEHDIHAHQLKNIKERILSLGTAEALSPEEKDELDNLNQSIKFFRSRSTNIDVESLILSWHTLLDTINNLGLKKIKLEQEKAAKAKIKSGLSDEEARELDNRYRDVLHKKDVAVAGLNENRENQKALEVDIERLVAKINKNSSAANQAIFKRDKFCTDLLNLFKEAVDQFSLELKSEVEKEASDIFSRLSHSTRYTGLKINDNYGLEIIDVNNEFVPNRSSGYEQVVAISLIGSLHHNTPISGPIFMDSTFQRIDPKHKRNVIKALPSLASQIIVLAYPEEFDRNFALNELKDRIVAELEIEESADGNHHINNKTS